MLVLSSFLSYRDDDRVYPKLYQDDEWKCLRKEYSRCQYDDSVNEIDWTKDLSAVYRFRRFFDSIKGFHSVSDRLPPSILFFSATISVLSLSRGP